ncbi:hypothetical protein QJQ58_08170 [Paenibacillus dendritiformis]|uniref:hypothetical protein n=1 Tax=Paenibacillus dendritiformis TaxID=130049 RepID=UPI00248B21D5|nr:hypothetical protein [Paenibacillus dendritiformis]WGU96202.1 hypothetical protein QJQ58_08170 [Paenibacillus dendritiformis]
MLVRNMPLPPLVMVIINLMFLRQYEAVAVRISISYETAGCFTSESRQQERMLITFEEARHAGIFAVSVIDGTIITKYG